MILQPLSVTYLPISPQRSKASGRHIYLPETLGRILPRRPLKDLSSAWVLVGELGHVVHAAVDDDPEASVGGVVGRDVFGCVLRHLGLAFG